MIKRLKPLFKDLFNNYSKDEIFMEVTTDQKGFLHIRKDLYGKISNQLLDLGIPEYHFNKEFMGGFSKMIGGLKESPEYIQPAYFALYDFYIMKDGEVIEVGNTAEIAMYEVLEDLKLLVYNK